MSFVTQGACVKKSRDAGTKLARINKVDINKNGLVEAIKDTKDKGHSAKVKQLRNCKAKVTIARIFW